MRAATRRTRAARSSSARRPSPEGAGEKEKALPSAAAAQGGQRKEAGSGTQEWCATERPQSVQAAVGPGGATAGSRRGS
uniref:Uncharacterized protein n=1 Tax=Arundo donax TaxID=35708 RepID=A0A0A9EHX7_ARUDO